MRWRRPAATGLLITRTNRWNLERVKIRRSPCILVAGCVVRKDLPKVPEIEQVIAAGAAVENLLLAAADLGISGRHVENRSCGLQHWRARQGGGGADAGRPHIVAIIHLGSCR